MRCILFLIYVGVHVVAAVTPAPKPFFIGETHSLPAELPGRPVALSQLGGQDQHAQAVSAGQPIRMATGRAPAISSELRVMPASGR